MKVTDTLRSKLGVQDSCSLRCDMWHMMNEVWPKQNAFGSVHYDSVRHFLKGMLESRDKEYWENCYKSARRELMFCRQTEMAQYLDNIHAKPSYYAGYYLHTVIGGSLGKNGDTTAEQNHSSVVSYLGDGGNFSIAEQVKALLERHQDRVRKKTKQEQSLMVSIDRYKSPLPHGYQATEDTKAKKALSAHHAHKNFFLKSLKRGERLRHDFNEDGDCRVWPIQHNEFEDAGEDVRITILNTERCTCSVITKQLV
jgi:hypothetical protein